MPRIESILRVIVGALLSLVLVALLVGVVARLSDGPLAILAGGPFERGSVVRGAEPDWSFVRDVREVEFQLLEPARSRTTWILEHEGKAYIPSGYMTSWWGRLWKQWPHEAVRDGRALLRIGDEIYERQLVRVESGAFLEPLLRELGRKYMNGAEIPVEVVESGSLWLFELAPRR